MLNSLFLLERKTGLAPAAFFFAVNYIRSINHYNSSGRKRILLTSKFASGEMPTIMYQYVIARESQPSSIIQRRIRKYFQQLT